MKRVFLSYAKEDQAVADRVAHWLRERDIEPYWFQDERQRGRRFVGEMERAIAEADLFVVLLSRHFMTSAWCRHERELALRREIDLPRQLIWVLKVAETVPPESGFLGNYDHIDATPPLTAGKLDRIATALDLDREPETPGESPPGPAVLFRNRDDELDAVVNALTRSGGQDVWVVVAPPKMGKSWFLNQVHRSLMEKDSRWSARLVDLREHPRELCGNLWRLLAELLDLDVPEPGEGGGTREEVLRRIARHVSGRSRRQLYLLDSADMLEPACADELRSALTEIYHRVKTGGNRATRIGLVIGSRRADTWRGLGRDRQYRLRYQVHPLTQFSVDVVHEALAELDWDHGADRRWAWAEDLHRLSEGLPALLIRSLTWALANNFFDLEECSSDTVFDDLARPYIREDLLTVDSLLPWRRQHEQEARRVLERALRILATYRLFTQAHLRYHLNSDEALRSTLHDAKWKQPELWEALAETSLCSQPVKELWLEIEPAIRRLLYRYYNTSAADRAAAHLAARNFYIRWTPVRNAGREQQVVLVECLWHEASRMVIEQPADVERMLPGVAADLAREFANSPLFEPDELRDFVVGRLDDDEEFQMLLQAYPGLFQAVTDQVARTIGGGST